jgi:hypothetical protein
MVGYKLKVNLNKFISYLISTKREIMEEICIGWKLCYFNEQPAFEVHVM